jgi:hypothetical protein
MYISLVASRANGFRKWSDAHPPHSNDDDGDVARDDAIAIADSRISQYCAAAHRGHLKPSGQRQANHAFRQASSSG